MEKTSIPGKISHGKNMVVIPWSNNGRKKTENIRRYAKKTFSYRALRSEINKGTALWKAYKNVQRDGNYHWQSVNHILKTVPDPDERLDLLRLTELRQRKTLILRNMIDNAVKELPENEREEIESKIEKQVKDFETNKRITQEYRVRSGRALYPISWMPTHKLHGKGCPV